MLVVDADGTEEEAITFSQHLACTDCGLSFDELAPATSPSTRPTGPARPAPAWAPASRSTPSWWCPIPTKSLAEGALAPWAGARSEYFTRAAGRPWPS